MAFRFIASFREKFGFCQRHYDVNISNKLYLNVENNVYIIQCNLSGRFMGGFKVGALRSPHAHRKHMVKENWTV